MLTWHFTILLTSAVLCSSTRIRLEDQGYVDIVVNIDHQVRENPHLVQNLKVLMNSTSAFLHRATRELVYFKSVTIVLPHTWSDAIPFEPISGAMLSNADIRITNTEDDLPQTTQANGCGERGEYIIVPSTFVENLMTTTKKRYKRPEQIMTHEWAHFRYGVYDEYGSPGDPQYPAMYVRDGQKKPNVCSDRIAVSPQTKDGDPCDVVEGSTQDDCIDFVPIDEFTEASSSIMFLPVVSSVYTFCDDDKHKHNAEAPNPQNALCASRSTWDVISQNSDFEGILSSPVKLQPTTFRTLKANVKERMVLVLDVSTSMGLNGRMAMLRRAAARLIKDTVNDGTDLGLVTFHTDATILANLTEVNGYTRASLQASIPRDHSGSTAIGRGLLAGIKVLEASGRSIENSVIILMSDGEENVDPYINTVKPVLVQKRIIVHTLALGTKAEKGLEDLARATGGKSFAVTNENRNGLERLVKAFTTASIDQRPIELKPVTLVDKLIPLEGNTTSLFVTVDRELGKNLEFLASGGDGATTAVVAKSPSGRTYPAEYDGELNRHKVSIGEAEEPGKWQVDIKRHNPTSEESVSVTVVSEPKDPDDPPVRARTFFNTRNVPYAKPSTQLKIFVELKKGEKAVKGAHVVANVTTPLGNHVPVWLKDSGVGADILEGDGIYSGFYAAFSSPGRYSVEVQAFGDESTNLVTPKRPDSGRMRRARRSAGPLIFERYDNGGVFVVDKIQAALIYPPETIRDLRVERASYSDNGTRTVSLTWTSPGAHLDEGTCHNITVIASRNRTSLLYEDTECDFYAITMYDIVNGTLDPKESGEPHEVTFLIPDAWVPPNDSPHDVYFIVNTWNSDGVKSNRSNVAVANFFERPKSSEKELTIWEKVFASTTTMYIISAVFIGVLFTVVVILVVNIFGKKSSPYKGVERVAVFRAAPVKYEVEKACRKNLLKAP